MRQQSSTRAAFTLIEALITLGIVALLISLMIAGLQMARGRASEAKALASLRSGLSMFVSWSNDRRDEHLNYRLDPHEFSMRCDPWINGENECVQWEYQAWNQRWVYSWFWTTGEVPEVTGFSYAFTFLTDSRMWQGDAAPTASRANAYYRPTFASEVAYPSDKVMLYGFAHGPAGPALGFVDGSAAKVQWTNMLPQAAGPFTRGNYQRDLPGWGTKGGLAGRDVRTR